MKLNELKNIIKSYIKENISIKNANYKLTGDEKGDQNILKYAQYTYILDGHKIIPDLVFLDHILKVIDPETGNVYRIEPPDGNGIVTLKNSTGSIGAKYYSQQRDIDV